MAPDTYDVTVIKEGLQDIADQQIEVVPSHTITSFPEVVDLGEQITITGTNLDAPAPTFVTIDGGNTQIVSSSPTEVLFNVPIGMPNRGQGKVLVVRAGLSVLSDDDMYVRHGVSTDFSTTNYVVDQEIYIDGNNFTDPNVTGVTINGVAATFLIISDSRLRVTIPDAVGTDGSVVITRPAPVGDVTAGTTIDIVPRAILSSIAPEIKAIGNTIAITGQNFESPDVSNVTINGRTASFMVESDTEITATVSNNPVTTQGVVVITRAGIGKVAVTRRGLAIESAQALVISAQPVLTAITPDARIAGGTSAFRVLTWHYQM